MILRNFNMIPLTYEILSKLCGNLIVNFYWFLLTSKTMCTTIQVFLLLPFHWLFLISLRLVILCAIPFVWYWRKLATHQIHRGIFIFRRFCPISLNGKNLSGSRRFNALYGYVQNSPAVFYIYLTNAKAQDPSFHFNPHDNDKLFGQLSEYMFFPTGFDLHAFEILLKEKKNKNILHRCRWPICIRCKCHPLGPAITA